DHREPDGVDQYDWVEPRSGWLHRHDRLRVAAGDRDQRQRQLYELERGQPHRGDLRRGGELLRERRQHPDGKRAFGRDREHDVLRELLGDHREPDGLDQYDWVEPRSGWLYRDGGRWREPGSRDEWQCDVHRPLGREP